MTGTIPSAQHTQAAPTTLGADQDTLTSALSAINLGADPKEAIDAEVQRPFDHLPDEILSDILLIEVERIKEETRSLSILRAAPYRLSWVCRRWRNTAMFTAALWSNIAIQLNSVDGNVARTAAYTAYVETSSARSGTRPIDLRIIQSAALRDKQTPLLRILVALIHGDRVRQLELDLAMQDPIPALRHCLGGSKTNLRDLRVSGCSLDFIAQVDVPQTSFPSVSSVTVTSRMRPLPTGPSDTPGFTLANILRVFPRASNLRIDNPGLTRANILENAFLETLTITTSHNFDALAGTYRFPMLIEVEIEAFQLGPGILHFLENAFTFVRRLRLYDVCRGDSTIFVIQDDVALALSKLPRLESLSCSANIDASFFDTMRLHSSQICPRLAEIHLFYFSRNDKSDSLWSSLLDWIESRNEAATGAHHAPEPLRGEVTPFHRIPPDVKSRLQRTPDVSILGRWMGFGGSVIRR